MGLSLLCRQLWAIKPWRWVNKMCHVWTGSTVRDCHFFLFYEALHSMFQKQIKKHFSAFFIQQLSMQWGVFSLHINYKDLFLNWLAKLMIIWCFICCIRHLKSPKRLTGTVFLQKALSRWQGRVEWLVWRGFVDLVLSLHFGSTSLLVLLKSKCAAV